MFTRQQLKSLIQGAIFVSYFMSGIYVFSANVLIYDPLDNSSSITANNGTATGITYVSGGKYGNAASFASGASIAFDTEQPSISIRAQFLCG